MSISEMKQLLLQFGWSQAKLAKKLGVDPNTISRWDTVPEYAQAYLDQVGRLKRWYDQVFD